MRMTRNTTLLWALIANIKHSILKNNVSQLLVHKPVGLLGIEPSLRAPEARVLPVYYSPGAPCRTRTYDPTRVKGVLYQLS